MARKKTPEEHDNHERWLVSYADFITLLFAFFVVMYSISSVNEGKYRVLSDALTAAFRSPPKSLEPIQIGDPVRSPNQVQFQLDRKANIIEVFDMPLPLTETVPGGTGEDGGGQPTLAEISGQIEHSLQPLIDKELIRLKRTPNWLEVEINTSILFASGRAELAGHARDTLRRIAEILAPYPHPIYVEGFTDNVPISTPVYPSNWELSAARAASVVHLFSNQGVDPARMAAIGFGEFHPVADNASPEGRARNRRVVVIVRALRQQRVSPAPDDESSQASLDEIIRSATGAAANAEGPAAVSPGDPTE